MKLLCVGSVAYDSVATPFGKRERVLGGSATYFSVAASYFTQVGIVAVVGEDFRAEDRRLFEKHRVDTAGLVTVSGGKTFHWQGEYGYDLNDAQTLKTDLNVLGGFDPQVPEAYRDAPIVCLANVDPRVQMKVLDQLRGPKLVAADTMNYWIDNRRAELLEVLKRVHLVILNEAEARQLAQEYNLLKAGQKILAWGPRMVIIKRGEYGVLKVTAQSVFAAPAYPLESVFDPTGAGDTFAGGFMGFLATCDELDSTAVRQAIVMGSVMASFNVEDFSLSRLASLDKNEIQERFAAFKRLTEFSGLE